MEEDRLQVSVLDTFDMEDIFSKIFHHQEDDDSFLESRYCSILSVAKNLVCIRGDWYKYNAIAKLDFDAQKLLILRHMPYENNEVDGGIWEQENKVYFFQRFACPILEFIKLLLTSRKEIHSVH